MTFLHYYSRMFNSNPQHYQKLKTFNLNHFSKLTLLVDPSLRLRLLQLMRNFRRLHSSKEHLSVMEQTSIKASAQRMFDSRLTPSSSCEATTISFVFKYLQGINLHATARWHRECQTVLPHCPALFGRCRFSPNLDHILQ